MVVNRGRDCGRVNRLQVVLYSRTDGKNAKCLNGLANVLGCALIYLAHC